MFHNVIFVEDFDPDLDKLFISQILKRYLEDMYTDLKSRVVDKEANGLTPVVFN
jgi:hypothetical protein